MGFFHLINCILLATGPHFVAYKCTGLAEYNAFWKCAEVSLAYIMTQLSKMIFLATFFPPISPDASSGLGIFFEILRNTVDVVDLIGMYMVLQYLSGKGQFKIMVAGVGWAAADLVLTKYVPIWFGTRGLEFDWTYIRLSFEANLDLIFHIVSAALVWLACRKDLTRRLFPIVVGCLVFIIYRPIIFQVLSRAFSLTPLVLLLVKTVATICFGVIGLNVYSNWRGENAHINGKSG